MRLPMPLRDGGLKFNLTPMIDVVFNLIIFFLAASHLARSESAADVELPEASTGGPEESELNRRLVITILPDGTFDVGGATLVLPQVEQMILSGREAAEKHQFEVRIRTDRNAPYSAIEPLLMASARAGVTKIRFAVLPSHQND